MHRVRWFGLKLKLSVAELADRLKHRTYNAHQGDGFVLEQVRPSHLVARYVERVHRVDEIFDSFGNPEAFERFEYRSQRFRVSREGPGLEMLDAARSMRPLISRLLETVDFDLEVVPVSVDPCAWAIAVQQSLGQSGVIDRVLAKNVQIGADALASVQVDAKTDARFAFQKLVKKPDIRLDRVRIRFPGKAGMFTVTSLGGLEAKMIDPNSVVDFARTSLARMLSDNHSV
jgi:hypothetical protein